MLLKSVSFLDASDSDTPDVKDLKKHGVLIFISDSKMETWGRMEYIAKFGKFGDSNYVKSLDQWKPVKDIFLYFFCQPITCDKICSSDFSDKMNEMYTTVKDSRPKMYFVLHFENNDWNRNQTELNRYNFFKKAQQINV